MAVEGEAADSSTVLEMEDSLDTLFFVSALTSRFSLTLRPEGS